MIFKIRGMVVLFFISIAAQAAYAGWLSEADVPGFSRGEFRHWLSADYMNTHVNDREYDPPPYCQYNMRDLVLMEMGKQGGQDPSHILRESKGESYTYGGYSAHPYHHNVRMKYVIRTKNEQGKCQIQKGTWVDFYTGEEITNPSDAEVDHVVALKDAWNSGASKWSMAKRDEFANSDINLTVASKKTNTTKSANSITNMSKWMDEDSAYACEYVLRYVMVKKKYDLTFNSDEISVIKDFHKKTVKNSSGKKFKCLVTTAYKSTTFGWEFDIHKSLIR